MLNTISEQQLKKLRALFSKRGTAAEFCKRTGIKKQVISRIVSGERVRVNGDLYVILFPETKAQNS